MEYIISSAVNFVSFNQPHPSWLNRFIFPSVDFKKGIVRLPKAIYHFFDIIRQFLVIKGRLLSSFKIGMHIYMIVLVIEISV